MATLIICPACETRYQIKAAFPPEGRKVRCAKCGHVWQAQPAGAEAAAAPQPAPEAPKAPTPPKAEAPAAPSPAPEAPKAPPPPSPQAAPPAPPAPDAAPQAPPQAPTPPLPPIPEAAPPPAPQAAPPAPPSPPGAPPAPPAPSAEGAFEPEDALAAQVARMNAEAAMPGAGETPPEPEPEAEPPKKGGLFGKLMGKREKETPPPPPEMAPPPQGEAAFGAPQDTGLGAQPPGVSLGADASFDAGFPEEGVDDSALADPDLVAAAFGGSAAKEKKTRKGLPIVAIGWGILALIVLTVVGMFTLAPATTVSILPGASKIYSMLGMPVGSEGLAFEGVRYGWTSEGGQTVLEVQGNVRNTSSAKMTVPTVVIALRDENGNEISEWTTEVGTAELAAGEEAPFLRQIPAPPSNVRSLKVRFAEAN